jgi:hypothetical protein
MVADYQKERVQKVARRHDRKPEHPIKQQYTTLQKIERRKETETQNMQWLGVGQG